MTNKEILQKAIEMAVEGGWEIKYHNTLAIDIAGGYLNELEELNEKDTERVNDIIFSHDFAKAFWGEKGKRIPNCAGGKSKPEYLEQYPRDTEGKCPSCGTERWDSVCPPYSYYAEKKEYQLNGYKDHLQQMVLEKDPLKYIEKYLNETNST